MATIDASVSAILKTRAVDNMEKNIFSGNPVMALVKKLYGVGGKSVQTPIQTGGCPARGKVFATAVALVATSTKVEMDVQHQEAYVFGKVGGIESVLASGGQNSVGDILGTEQDIIYQQAADMVEQMICRGDSYGTIAKISSIVSGTTGTVVMQLDNNGDAFSIFVGDALTVKTDPTTASLVSATAATVTAVNPLLGQITVNANGIDLSGQAGSSIGLSATFANSTAVRTMQGLRSLFTNTGLSNAFEGLASRASDPVRLAGHVFSTGGMGVKDCITLLANSIGVFGSAKPEYALVSPNAYVELESELGAKVRYSTTSGSGPGKGAGVDFETITFSGPRGPITVVSCPKLHDKDVFLIDPSSLYLHASDSELVTPTDNGEEGSGWIQMQTEDSKRLGLRILGGFSCRKFFANGRAIRS